MIDDPKRDEARRERAERAFKRREEGAQAMRDYEAEGHAVRAKTARLKAQREERADKKAVIIPIKAESGGRPPSEKASVKAAAMAGNEIDRLCDRSATDEQRASRKRRLIEGPREFREIRDEKALRG
jgi:hypothetical protein